MLERMFVFLIGAFLVVGSNLLVEDFLNRQDPIEIFCGWFNIFPALFALLVYDDFVKNKMETIKGLKKENRELKKITSRIPLQKEKEEV